MADRSPQYLNHQHPGVEDDGKMRGNVAGGDPEEPGSRSSEKKAPPMTNARLKPTLVTARVIALDRGRLLPEPPRCATGTTIGAMTMTSPTAMSFGAQERRGLAGDEDEARRGDRADRPDQRFARAARQKPG